MTCQEIARPRGLIKLEIEAFAPCPVHAADILAGTIEGCDCPKESVGKLCDEYDLGTLQLTQFIQALILASTQTITDTGGVGRSIANNTATSAITIAAGTNSTAAAYNDTALGTQTETVGGTVNASSGSGVSSSFTVTGTITAGSNRTYAEVGLVITAGAHTFLLCHDVFSGLAVSSGGTLATTYTLNIS